MNQHTETDRKPKLPEPFLEDMEKILGEEFSAFLESFQEEPQRGLRLNPMKIRPETFGKEAPFPVREIPWIRNGYRYQTENETVRPSRHPWYRAGLYYLQEPSAMTPADRLPVDAGDRVLDLCAAPGGKATQLAGKLAGSGLLVANEISNTRAKALLRNLELFGTRNFMVTNEPAERLAGYFPEFFDKILTDAPCSGEGMFRRKPETAEDWSREKVRRCASMQKTILDAAASLLRPGGLLLYSTCTFSAEEDERQIAAFLAGHPEFSMERIEPYEGFAEGMPDLADGNPQLKKCVRIWPHRMDGEGHFLALMRKAGDKSRPGAGRADVASAGVQIEKKRKKKRSRTEGIRAGRPEPDGMEYFTEFTESCGIHLPADCRVDRRADRLYLVPEDLPLIRGVHFLRNGLYLGELKKKRFEPSQPFALALSPETCRKRVSLDPSDPALEAFLRGESIRTADDTAENGWVLVCAGAYPVGWAKQVNGLLKNKIPAAWRAGS